MLSMNIWWNVTGVLIGYTSSSAQGVSTWKYIAPVYLLQIREIHAVLGYNIYKKQCIGIKYTHIGCMCKNLYM